MGKVTEQLLETIRRQIANRGIVVWYDPQKAYSSLAASLALPGVSVLRFEDGFFRLREQLEPYLEYVTPEGGLKPDADQPPSVVVYVPLVRGDTGCALIEAETAGVVMEPSAARPECNTRLGALVEQVFGLIAPAKASHMARQADEGLLTLDDLDHMAEEAGSSATGALQVVFGETSAEEILLQFVAADKHDKALIEKNALDELADLIREECGLEEATTDSPAALRDAVQRFLLMSDLLLQIPEPDIPDALRRMPLPCKAPQREMVRHVCNLWRNRLDLKDSYVEAAEAVERASGLAGVSLREDHVRLCETFPIIERLWLNAAAADLVAGRARAALETTRARLPLFWARERPTFHIEWKVIEAATEVCDEAIHVQDELKKRKWSLDDLIQAYACHAEPWMRLDRQARHLETRYAQLDVLETGGEGLEKAVVLARQRYADAVQALALAYSSAAAEAEFGSQQFSGQSHIFKEKVRPLTEKGQKTAYFLVDALRYEMAAELLDGLKAEYVGHIEPVLGQLPGITAVGMAALLPAAEQGLSLEKESGGLGVRIQDKLMKSRQARMAWLTEHAGVPVAAFRLGEVVKLSPKRKKEVAAASLIVVTSQEIDRLGEEGGEEEETRVYMGNVLEKLHRGVRSLARAGVERFVIVADHGFQLVEGVDPGLSMDAPGGQTVELHARVWIGLGGEAAEGYIRLKASDLELGGPLEMAFPKGLGIFKAKGGTGAYFHGGLSLQEQILPLLTLEVESKLASTAASAVKVKLSMSKATITNRLFTVTAEATAEGFFPEAERRVRVEVLFGNEEVGLAAAATYGFEEATREVVLKVGAPDALTLMLTGSEPPPAVTMRVVDCGSQLVLHALKDIPVKLGI